MATLQSIRNHPAILTTVLGGGLILMIIMFGFDDYNGFFQQGRDTVLDVNGHAVSWTSYETERQRQSDFIQTLYNQDVNKSEINHQINNQVYSQFVQDIMLNEQLEKVGLSVSDAEVNELAQGSHISPVMTQIFGQSAQMYGQTFAQLVSTNGFDEFQQQYGLPFMTMDNWLVIEHQIISNRKAEKYNALLSAALQPNKLEAKDAFDGDNTEVAFSYVRKLGMEVADSLINVSNNEIKAYYENHKENFKLAQKTRSINYIATPLRPSADDRNHVLANLQKAAEEFATGDVAELVSTNSTVPFIDAYLNDNTFRGELKEFVDGNAAGAVSEPKVFAGDILSLIGERSENDERLSEYYYMARIMGKQTAPDSVKLVVVPSAAEAQDSLYNAIKNGSQDESATWATNLTTMNFEEGLRNKIEAAKKGDTFKYDFYNGQQQVYLVVRVLDKTTPVAQSKVAIYAEKISPSSKTRRTEYGKLNEFINEHPTLQQMQDSAMANGFRMRTATIAQTNYDINEVKDCRQAVRFAFDGKVGDISEIYEDGGYLMVVGIKGEIEEGYSSLSNEQLSEYIANMVRGEKKIAYLATNDFANVADKSIEGYAQAFGVEPQQASRVNFNLNSVSGLGVEPAVVAAALKADEGALVGPLQGNNCVVVLKVTSKNEKGLTYDEATYKNKVSGAAYRNAANVASQYLTRQAEITDNRIRFY